MAESVQDTPRNAAGSRRRRLREDEERDIARLYAETSTPTSEIRERFGIGDSSMYRALQRQGVALRGRTASSTTPNLPETAAPAARRRRLVTASGAKPAVSRPRSTLDTTEHHVRPRVAERSTATTGTTSLAVLASPRIGSGARHPFRIRFLGESVLEATDIRDALRQAEALGATEIMEVARVER